LSKKARIIKVIVASLGVMLLSIVFIFAYIFSSLSEGLSGPPPNEYAIHFEEVGETMYVRARAWGLAGNHQEIVIANFPITNFEYDRERVVVYLASTELYYKKVGRDTLEIQVDSPADLPRGFSSKVKIKQVRLDFATQNEARVYADNYKENGFSKVSVYPPK